MDPGDEEELNFEDEPAEYEASAPASAVTDTATTTVGDEASGAAAAASAGDLQEVDAETEELVRVALTVPQLCRMLVFSATHAVPPDPVFSVSFPFIPARSWITAGLPERDSLTYPCRALFAVLIILR